MTDWSSPGAADAKAAQEVIGKREVQTGVAAAGPVPVEDQRQDATELRPKDHVSGDTLHEASPRSSRFSCGS